MLQEAPVSNYRGHIGYLLSVDWSPVDPDVIWTGGKDFTVQEWTVSKQEFTKPPKGENCSNTRTETETLKTKPSRLDCNVDMFNFSGKKMVDLKEKMKANPKQKKKNKKASGAGGLTPSEINGGLVTGGEKSATAQELSGDDEEDGVSSTSSPVPPIGNRAAM